MKTAMENTKILKKLYGINIVKSILKYYTSDNK